MAQTKIPKIQLDATLVDTTTAQTLTNKNVTSGTNTFPTFNQNTTGSAATLTTARTIAGTSFNGSANVSLANNFIVQGTTDTGLTGAQFLGALATGVIKNTTTTGVLSIATAGTDYTTPNDTETMTNKSMSGSSNTFTNLPISALTGDWASWTSTISGLTVGNGTLVTNYIAIGKTIFWAFALTFGNTTSLGTSVDSTFTLPFAPATSWLNSQNVGQMVYNSAGTLFQGIVFTSGSSSTTGIFNAYMINASSVSTRALDSNNFGAGSTGNILSASGVYRSV